MLDQQLEIAGIHHMGVEEERKSYEAPEEQKHREPKVEENSSSLKMIKIVE